MHGKGGSEVTTSFVPDLSRVLATDVEDVESFVIGMDSNTTDAEEFRNVLLSHGIMSTEAVVDLSSKTVAKKRSPLQTQIRKCGVLDVSLKDFIVAWRHDKPTVSDESQSTSSAGGATSEVKPETDATLLDDVTIYPLVCETEHFPNIRNADSTDTISMLMPTAMWPFDHSMVLTKVNVSSNQQTHNVCSPPDSPVQPNTSLAVAR